ncbi:hypothetical protein H0H92_005225 [Tricholoma furcatifolium]|nr:hypothetical protein H0H92_005225 [Tricholoma furcatifolium]
MLSRATLLHHIQHGLSKHSVELVYTSHNLWPVPKAPLTLRQLRVLVLDASFNPPTLAHLALANSPMPHFNQSDVISSHDNEYDAKLLLLSVRNVDKALKPGDATYLQRLEMLEIFAADVTQSAGAQPANVAIAMIDEPTFVGKSKVLQSFFKSRFAEISQQTYDTQLNFILGWDTLERLIQPRYYGFHAQMMASLQQFLSPEGDNSRVVCARRSSSSFPSGTDVDCSIANYFISSGRIAVIEIDDEVKGYSSSEVRNTIGRMGIQADEWKRLVPREIVAYIVREGLYTSNEDR